MFHVKHFQQQQELFTTNQHNHTHHTSHTTISNNQPHFKKIDTQNRYKIVSRETLQKHSNNDKTDTAPP